MKELTLKQHGSVDTNLHMSWPEKFKPMLCQGQLYFSTLLKLGPLSPRHWLVGLQGGVGSHLVHPSMPFSLEMQPCHSLPGYSVYVGEVLVHCVVWDRKHNLLCICHDDCIYSYFLEKKQTIFSQLRGVYPSHKNLMR